MGRLIKNASRIPVPGGKIIDEYVGRVNTGEERISIAHMTAPPGWSEPPQTPSFHEYTLVLRGIVRVEHDGGVTDVGAGQAFVSEPGRRSATASVPTARSTSRSACPPSRRRPRDARSRPVPGRRRTNKMAR